MGRTSKKRRRLAIGFAALLIVGVSAPASADAYVYWANGLGHPNSSGSIGRALNDGTVLSQDFILSGEATCSVTVNGDHVYWANRGDASIGRANLDGTGPNNSFIGTGSSLPCGVGVNATHIYWANGGVADAIGRANLDGTSPDNTFLDAADGVEDPQGIALNSNHVFWGERDVPDSHVGRANLNGTGASNFINAGAFPNEVAGVAVNATHVFWTDFFADKIGRANLDGTGVNQGFIDLPGRDPCGVAVDDTYIYWANLNSDTIGRVRLDGTTDFEPDWITGANTPCGVATDRFPSTTNASVSCTPASVNVGQATTCTATVTDSSATPSNPTGEVDFTTGGGGGFTPAASCTLTPVDTDEGTCSVTYTPTAVSGGSHLITGDYEGDTEHAADEGSFSVTVAGRPTSTGISCAPTSVLVNEGSSCTVTVNDTGGAGASTPTGTVDLSSDGAGGFSPDPCTLSAVDADTASCTTTYTPTAFGDGSHGLTASYGGDSLHAGSNGQDDVAVSKRPTSTAVVCAPASVVVGQGTTCTATVTDGGSAGTPVQPAGDAFFSSLPLGGGSVGASCTLAGSGVGASSCSVTYTPNSVGSGTHTVNGEYDGSGVHNASNGDGNVTVGLRSTTTEVDCAPPSVQVGTPVSCGATVEDVSPGSGSSPTGSVSFASDTPGGGFSPSTTCALSADGPTTSSCTVTYTPGQVGSGTHSITADYPGDATHGDSDGSGPVGVTAIPASALILDPPEFAIVGNGFPVECSVDAGELSSCAITATAGGKSAAGAVAQGSASGSGSSLTVQMKMTKRGRKAVRKRLGGLAVTLKAHGTSSTGVQLDSTGKTSLLAAKQSATPSGSMFGPFQDELNASGRAFLAGVAKKLRRAGTVRCVGHTASIESGPNRYTNSLGLRRAKAACDRLKSLGVKAKFVAVTRGKRGPRAPNSTGSGRALNRYVGIEISR